MQSDLFNDEDMSFMAYSEQHFFFLFIIAINHVEKTPTTWEKMLVTIEADKFLALCRDSHVSYLYPVYVAPPPV